MLSVVLTFDYEIFFGKNYGTYEYVLFDGTKKLIDMLKKKTSATFFADTCSIHQAIKYNDYKYVTGFINQIREMIQKKQDVQLHIHPHWLKSEYSKGEWVFDKNYYRIHSFGFCGGQYSIQRIIHDGVEVLNNALLEVDKNYKCIAYRAGGFCIQPHEKVVDILYDEGIRIDSSITPNLHADDSTHYYDFRNNNLKNNWWIGKGEWYEDSAKDKKKLYEIPIATVKNSFTNRTLNKLFLSRSNKLQLGEKRGSYINNSGGVRESMLSHYARVLKTGSEYNLVSMDAYKAEYLYKQLKKFSEFCEDNDSYIAIIGHPKLCTDVYITNVSQLIDYINNDRTMNIMSIRDIYDKKFGE